MNRRQLLAATGSAILPLAGGCADLERNTGYTYALTLSGSTADPTAEILECELSGLTRSQKGIVEEAIRTGSYSEAGVTWRSLPGRTGITMEFRMVIQLIARHVGRDPTVARETSFETPSRYDDAIYRSRVTVE